MKKLDVRTLIRARHEIDHRLRQLLEPALEGILKGRGWSKAMRDNWVRTDVQQDSLHFVFEWEDDFNSYGETIVIPVAVVESGSAPEIENFMKQRFPHLCSSCARRYPVSESSCEMCLGGLIRDCVDGPWWSIHSLFGKASEA